MKETIRKKYTAHVTGFDTTAYGTTSRTIQVNDVNEARNWCEENSFMGGYQWHIDYLTENKDYGK